MRQLENPCQKHIEGKQRRYPKPHLLRSLSSEDSTDTPDMGNVCYNENPSPNEFGVNRLQIIITSIIGLFCLVELIIARNISALNADMEVSTSATGTQFRNLISG